MILKRIFDFFTALIASFIFSPFFLFIPILIKWKMPGPIFFIQKRVGQYGHLFKLIKFRSMVIGHGGNSITVKGESRITQLGAFLRRHKLDELPELWNIVKGEMSFVGPRPEVPGYADNLMGEDRNILKLKPGLTGPATLKYRHEEQILARQVNPVEYNDKILYPDKTRINLKYFHKRNFFLDLKIIAYTIMDKDLHEY
jgi:lipopolysaccharide/colanic/teichoic acid biosynthesis glycosyltransferase